MNTKIEILKTTAGYFNNVLKDEKLTDTDRFEVLQILKDGICVNCGEVTNRCYCDWDE